NTHDFEDFQHPETVDESGMSDAHFQVSEPDPGIAISSLPVSVLTGANVVYTITVTNQRSGAARDVTVTEMLPSSLTFASCTATAGGICGGTNNNRTVTFAGLAGGAAATITIVARVNCTLGDGTAITNSVDRKSGV